MSTHTSRRAFVKAAGGAVAIPVTALGLEAATRPATGAADLNAIRAMNNILLQALASGDAARVRSLFVQPSGADAVDGFRAIAPDQFGARDTVAIADDGVAARACLYVVGETDSEIGPSCPLVEMARQQDGGRVRRRGAALLEATYDRRDGTWKLRRITQRWLDAS